MYKVKTSDYCELSCALVPAGEAASSFCDGTDAPPAAGTPLARIAFPEQEYAHTFCPNRALMCGTAFPELVNAV